MMREFTIPGGQAASPECPAIPRTVKVYAETKQEALKMLAAALTEDPDLKLNHPELHAGAVDFKDKAKEEKTKKPKKS